MNAQLSTRRVSSPVKNIVKLPLIRTGHLQTSEGRTKALKYIRNGGTIQMVIGDRYNGIGGIFFDIDNEASVKEVIRIKSTPEKQRKSLFGLMTPDDYFLELLGTSYAFELNNKSERPPFFIRIPVKTHHQFPQWAVWPGSAGVPLVQCFLSDTVAHFSNLIREAREAGFRLGGTSTNKTGAGNITTIEEIYDFFIKSGSRHFYLHTRSPITGVSYTIVELHPTRKELKLIRQGGVDFQKICDSLKLAPGNF